MQSYHYHLRIHIEDTDYAGVVYHANYLKFFERARSLWALEQGYGSAWQHAENIYFPVRYAYVDYLKPARLHNEVEVVTTILHIGRASILYQQHLYLTGAIPSLLCQAKIKVACVNKNTLRPQSLPLSLLPKLHANGDII